MFFQYIEFKSSDFSISSGIFGTCFFGLTGFHRLHVVVGTRLLVITVLRCMINSQMYKFVRLDCSFIY